MYKDMDFYHLQEIYRKYGKNLIGKATKRGLDAAKTGSKNC